MLSDREWKLKYTPEDGDLVKGFYIPALEDAERYDRLTGYFNAGALALAARGIEGLVRNNGRMRLVVGCTLDQPEIDAIEKGEAVRGQVEKHLADMPLMAPDAATKEALELVSWMVAHGYLEVKVAVPCDEHRNPVPDNALFHEKSGIIEDRGGDRIAWTGSLNETAAGWRRNWETINVFKSWGPERDRVDEEERNFASLWVNRPSRVIVIDVPEAVRRDLLRFMPAEGMPKRLKRAGLYTTEPEDGETDAERRVREPPAEYAPVDRRSLVWAFIANAPRLPGGGALVGEATAAVTPWPHQVRAFEKLYGRWPSKLLIADEVGLGKTIQAGMLLRQAWLSGRAKRILVMAPKAVLGQWQIELREKFNLNWPIYDGRKLVRYPSPALRGQHERVVARSEWHREPVVITSSHLMRRRDRADALLDEAEPWDLVVLDEAHHARRRGAGGQKEGGPNALLGLMRVLRDRTQGLVLLTATPMQVHTIEVWDLLDLLGLPPEWTAQAFLKFFDDKLERLKATIDTLRGSGYEQTMVFTQYGDTMEFLREELRKDPDLRLMCYSGRGGEIPTEGGPWRAITRDDAKRRFRLGEADVLLCTDAAAEGLNFQFCGALVNYDMPWNPMRVEQRIGRIDRLGQRHSIVRISNLHYEDTVETDVYRALGSRINLFQRVVGPLQPILARLPGTITNTVLADPRTEAPDRAGLREAIERQIDEGESGGFDIDAVLEEDWTLPERPAPAMTMDDLDRVIGAEDLMPQGTQVRPLGAREYALRAPGMASELRVTTDPDYYEEHTESVEFWSPGNPLFNAPETLETWDETSCERRLRELLEFGPRVR